VAVSIPTRSHLPRLAYATVAIDPSDRRGSSRGGVFQLEGEASNWYRKAESGSPAKWLLLLGNWFEDGKRVPQNHQEAVRLYKLAAEKGELDAAAHLGDIYFEGRGVPGAMQDYNEAVRWWIKTSERGHAQSMIRLATMYEKGLGVSRGDSASNSADLMEAYKWFNIAAATLGSQLPEGEGPKGKKAAMLYESAVRSRDNLAKQLSPEQLAEAQRRASAFVVKPNRPN
jgi:TPR repeat protein